VWHSLSLFISVSRVSIGGIFDINLSENIPRTLGKYPLTIHPPHRVGSGYNSQQDSITFVVISVTDANNSESIPTSSYESRHL
jgi:hypothetical protein